MTTLKKFTTSASKPLPVIILADVSGSMFGPPINMLNQAMADMISSFAGVKDERAEIHVAVITFGGKAAIHTPLTPAAELIWTDMSANDSTPMGGAFELARQMMEDKDAIPSKAFRPMVVLLSDGAPTDNWEEPLQGLLSGRAAKAERLAMGIGAADKAVLRKFLDDLEKPIFEASDASHIVDFFQFVTMSVTARSRSANPNALIPVNNPFQLG